MFRSWKIGKIAGINLQLHATFLLLLGWLGVTSLSSGDSLQAAVNLLFPLGLFTIVVLHELGHALAARHFGIQTREITLYPIGGVARLERMPSQPRQEMLVAAAGPAVNVALAGVAGLLSPLVTQPLGAYILGQFVVLNLGLALFNLLPAFPMDGGRILRAYLTLKVGAAEATRRAAKLGRKLAWVLGIAGLVTFNLNLVLIGIFVWAGSTMEQGRVALDGFLGRGRPTPPPQMLYNFRRPAQAEVIDAEYWEVAEPRNNKSHSIS